MVLAGLAVKRIDTKSVGIRVSSKDDICILLLSQLQCQGKGLGIFRVRILQCGKVGIWKLLLRYYIYMLEAKL